DADLRRAAHELRALAVLRLDRVELLERGRAQEGLPPRLVVERGPGRHRRRLREPELEEIGRGRVVAAATLLLGERVEHGVADGSVPRAAAQVAVELVADLASRVAARVLDVVAVVRLEHRDD